MRGEIRAVLFDLDGTLIDSAPDLAGTANDMRAARGLPPMLYRELRPMVGTGARGMLAAAFDLDANDTQFAAMRDEFLARYETRLLRDTRIFEGIPALLDALDSTATRWGIVTNKIMRFTVPIVEGLGLRRRAAAVVAGDTTPFPKPHPAPLIEAARQMAVAPEACVYVGDDLRDVIAGRAAGMRTAAVEWGYHGVGAPVATWDAEHILKVPADLLNLLAVA